MRTELVSIPTPTHPLDGAWYEPDEPSGRAVQILHGNCMNFYTGPSRFLPAVLAGAGWASLAYNRRGHDILATTNGRGLVGGGLQLTHEALEDNALAADWLAAKAFGRPAVIGHSNGGVLAARHVADRPGVPALVLMSAHLGGRGIVPAISAAGLLAGDRHDAIMAEAGRLVAAGRGRDLLLLPGWWSVASAESLLDYATHLPDLLEAAPAIACPVLFVRGDREPPAIYPAEAFADRCAGRCEVVIVPDCDHFYTGRELYVAQLIVEWLHDHGR